VGVFKAPGFSLPQARVVLYDVTTREGRAKLFPVLAALTPEGGDTVAHAGLPDGSRVFWLRVSVPRGQPAGRYRGKLRLTGAAGRRTDVPLVLDVQPFDLMGACKQYVYVGQHLWSAASPTVKAMHEAGFGLLGIEATGDDLWDGLTACQSQRLRGPVPYCPTGPEPGARADEIEAARREKQLPPLLWLFPVTQLADAVRLRAAGVPSGVILGPQDALPEPTVDTVIYPTSAAYPQALLAGTARKTSRAAEWWTWEPAAATPAQNRLYAGFLLWRAGLSGVYLREGPEEDVGTDPLLLARRWEAIRAGVDDVRHLTTLYALIRQCKDMDRRHPLPARAEAAVAATLSRLTPDSPMSAADAARRQIADWIVRLRGVVM
jgi:hypothetical protein